MPGERRKSKKRGRGGWGVYWMKGGWGVYRLKMMAEGIYVDQ